MAESNGVSPADLVMTILSQGDSSVVLRDASGDNAVALLSCTHNGSGYPGGVPADWLGDCAEG